MTERERLIELLEEEKAFSRYMTDDERREKLADYLLDHGVLCPPCKVGDTVYEIDYTHCECGTDDSMAEYYCIVDCESCSESIMKPVVKPKTMYGINDIFHWWSYFGKTIFLTKEEAEKALKARNNNA